MRILFITATRLGDAVLSRAVLGHLHQTYPHARWTIAAGSIAAPFFEDFPNLERLISLPSKKFGQHWLKIWASCIGKRWDLVIDLRGSAISYVLWTKARQIWRKPKDQSIPRYQQLCQFMGEKKPFYPPVYLTTERQEQMDQLLRLDEGPILAFGPTANWPAKEWPLASFQGCISALTGPNGLWPRARLVILAAPAEQNRLEEFYKELPQDRWIDTRFVTHILDTAAILNRCQFFVGNDSGLMHLAAAVGIPAVGLFGPTNDILYQPMGPCASYIRTPEPLEILVEQAHNNPGVSMMTSLTVRTVVDHIAQQVSQARTA